LYFDGALVPPPPACADTSEPNDISAIEAAITAMFLNIGPSIIYGSGRRFPFVLLLSPNMSRIV
jgi:hypothetical protein